MKFVSILALFLLLSGSIVYAQSTDVDLSDPNVINTLNQLDYQSSINDSDIDATTDPEAPAAFQSVSIHLDSNTVDLNRYPITWLQNGVIQQSGIGLRDFQTTTGAYGTTKTIVAQIRVGLVPIQKTITLAPQDATILWEAVDSYVPAFYHGKKLAGPESLIKISAFPNFGSSNNSLNLGDAVYLWDRNDNRILGVGGYGKNSIIIKQNRLRTNEIINAVVSSMDGSSSTQKSITIPTYKQEVHWYTRDLSGYRRLISVDSGVRVVGGDVTLVAEPYFFSLDNDGVQGLDAAWTMNNATLVLDPDAPNSEILVKNPNQTGQTSFGISLSSPATFLQTAAKTISLYFENQSQ